MAFLHPKSGFIYAGVQRSSYAYFLIEIHFFNLLGRSIDVYLPRQFLSPKRFTNPPRTSETAPEVDMASLIRIAARTYRPAPHAIGARLKWTHTSHIFTTLGNKNYFDWMPEAYSGTAHILAGVHALIKALDHRQAGVVPESVDALEEEQEDKLSNLPTSSTMTLLVPKSGFLFARRREARHRDRVEATWFGHGCSSSRW
ncbi:uncharacterized protein EV420DRAFT_1701660 [Desarmillaria tabescens]|uniref:Uncharacterized protein n=1 Tax=Armillaria tabescens TaxID=1929756 RepID=A0AA39K2X4_ARMTA|nr:uncharacterized protein EV420DRAFT_1701660 [Desarmillaria tabescens]KAK0452184.1 hypothetical protein EV420DRAFT_1701660 [Desarmillaria tabescens]